VRPLKAPSGWRLKPLLVAAALGTAGAAIAGVEPSPFRPASLVTANLVMSRGLPFVPLAELARALGGTGRYEPARVRYDIQPGAAGVLIANPGMLATLAPAINAAQAPRGGLASGQPFKLAIGGQEMTIKEEDTLLLRPADPAISLQLLARLLGGQARFDAGKGMWVLPPGGPGSPLRFR
jgi:hypothetical protein